MYIEIYKCTYACVLVYVNVYVHMYNVYIYIYTHAYILPEFLDFGTYEGHVAFPSSTVPTQQTLNLVMSAGAPAEQNSEL